ncbi:MAG: DNA-binding protein WhiA, partial [Eubacteriales bacterium]|nr:DNA-binding protein WhiA [Eubacteriales bacterium]
AGFVRLCGAIKLSGGGRLELKLSTENAAVARRIKTLLKSYFGVGTDLFIGKNPLQKKGHIYELLVGVEDNAEQILRETGILRVREGCNYFPDDISLELVKSKCCRRAYLRGAFLGAGTMSDPEKSYHLELICNSEALANDFRRLINGFGFKSKTAQRRNSHIVYLKEGEQISDFLALLGAHNHVMEFENVRIMKELRNKTNRIVNCENANLDKTIESAARQLYEINLINEKKGLDSLPPKLREAAQLRLENPEASLLELAEMTQPPIKKSGINHRFQKIADIAQKLK